MGIGNLPYLVHTSENPFPSQIQARVELDSACKTFAARSSLAGGGLIALVLNININLLHSSR